MGFAKAMIILMFSLLIFVSKTSEIKYQRKSAPLIRIINNTEHVFSNVSLFSMNFEDLQPHDTTAYRKLSLDILKDDPLIYCMEDNFNYGRYVQIPEEEGGKFSYRIDSLQNGMIHIEFIKENRAVKTWPKN